MSFSIIFSPSVTTPDVEPWLVKDGSKVIGAHFTLEAAVATFENALQRAGHVPAGRTLTELLRDLRKPARASSLTRRK